MFRYIKIGLIFIFFILQHVVFPQPQNWLHYFETGDLNDHMNHLIYDNEKRLWAIKYSTAKFLYFFDLGGEISCKTSMTPVFNYNNTPYNSYFHIVPLKNGDDIIVFMPDSILKISKSNPSIRKTIKKLDKFYKFYSAYEVEGKGIYVGLSKGTIYLFRNDSLEYVGQPVENRTVFIKYYDSQQRLWCTVRDSGLMYLKDGKWTLFHKGNSGIATNKFSGALGRIFIERPSGEIIVGSNESGILVFKNGEWSLFSSQPPHISKEELKTELMIRCLGLDSSGAMWVGTDYGVYWYKENEWYWYTIPDYYKYHAPYGNTFDIFVDPQNRVWIAMLHDGVLMVDQSSNPVNCKKDLKFTYPVTGSVLRAGDNDSIWWDTYGNVDSVTIYLKYNDNQEWKKLVVSMPSFNRRSRFWKVPDTVCSSVYLRIIDYEDSTAEDIVGPISIVREIENRFPEIKDLPDTVIVKRNETTRLIIRAVDADGDTVRISTSTLPGWVTLEDSVMTFSPDEGSVSFTFTVTVSDNRGGIARDSVRVVVESSTVVFSGVGKASSEGKEGIYIITGKDGITVIPSLYTSDVEDVVLYDLSGKVTGRFERFGEGEFRIDSRGIAGKRRGIYLIRVRYKGQRFEPGASFTIHKILL